MKISAKQKKENKRRLIAAATELITDKGMRATSMRAIAREAEVGDATIYNYFPTKEAILYAFYAQSLEQAVAAIKGIEDFNQYSLHEQMQVLFETILEEYLPHREFVAETFPAIFFNPIPVGKRLKVIRDRFVAIVNDLFEAAVEAGEIPEPMMGELVTLGLWDFYIATVLYWLKDESDQFTNTSVFIDRSMDLGYTMLKAEVMNKVAGIASFLFKTHVLSRVDTMHDQMDSLRRIKREFLGHE